MSEVTDRQLAYFAGIVDVMALLRIREVGPTSLPFLAISGPNMPLLKWVAERTGTGVTVVNRNYQRNNCATHCPEPHIHIVSSTGRWSLTGVRATVVLSAVLPYLQLQAEVAAGLLDVGLRAPRKPATLTKMAGLGWPIPTFLPSTKKLSE